MNMTFVDVLMLLSSTGVLGIGIGIFKWAFSVEKRLTVIETKQEVMP